MGEGKGKGKSSGGPIPSKACSLNSEVCSQIRMCNSVMFNYINAQKSHSYKHVVFLKCCEHVTLRFEEYNYLLLHYH